MIRQRASAPGSRERRSIQQQQQQQNSLPQYHQYQQQQQQESDTQQSQENTVTWSNTTNDSSDNDLVDEELGGAPDLPPPLTSAPASLPPTSSVPYPAPHSAPIPTHPSYYRTLYFQIPDSKYREHHHHQQQSVHHYRKVRMAPSSSLPSSPPTNSSSAYASINAKASKYRFLYFFSSPHMFARALGWYSVVAMIFLLFVGLLIDLQPLYIRGVLPRTTLQNPRALRKFKVLIPSGSGATRLDAAKHAYQAAFAYFVTMCVCWMYGYHWIERAWARIRRRHYKDIPDHYYPDDIHNSNSNHHHNNKDPTVLSKLASSCAPCCSRIHTKSRRVCQSICRSSNSAPARHPNQTLQWQSKCLAFLLWWQRLFGVLGDVCGRTIRRAAASMRYSTTRRTRTRRSTTTTASNSLMIPNGNAATTTTTANTTATQRKRRKHTSTTNRNESQSPPNTGANETTAALSSKHKHG